MNRRSFIANLLSAGVGFNIVKSDTGIWKAQRPQIEDAADDYLLWFNRLDFEEIYPGKYIMLTTPSALETILNYKKPFPKGMGNIISGVK